QAEQQQSRAAPDQAEAPEQQTHAGDELRDRAGFRWRDRRCSHGGQPTGTRAGPHSARGRGRGHQRQDRTGTMSFSKRHRDNEMIYQTPPLTTDDETVLAEIHEMRRALALVLRAPRRWRGGLRRTMLARAIRGSNSIEGYVVTEDDAAAA